MSTGQLSISFGSMAPTRSRPRSPYVIQGQERPDDLPKLKASASRMESLVLEYFASVEHGTPSQCAQALGVEVTSVRPRITQLRDRGELERMTWLPRVPTARGSEGVFRRARKEVTE